MPIAIFYLDIETYRPEIEIFDDNQLLLTLDRMKMLRNAGHRFVVPSSEMAGSIGKPGVDSVKDGKTPDGVDYEWSKAHRAGATKKSDATRPSIATRNGD